MNPTICAAPTTTPEPKRARTPEVTIADLRAPIPRLRSPEKTNLNNSTKGTDPTTQMTLAMTAPRPP